MNNVEMIPQYDTKLFTDVFDDAGTFVYYYKNVGIPTTISDTNALTLYYLLYARYGNSPIANYDEEQFKYKIFSVVFQYGPTWEKRLSVQKTLRDMQLSDLIDNGQLAEIFSGQGSNSQINSSINENTRTLNTNEANTGTVGVAGTSEDIKNHAFNPGTAPAQDAYSPLAYINEQTAEQVTNSSTTTNSLNKADTGTITDAGTVSGTISGTDSKSHTNTTTMTAGKLKAYEKLLELLDSDVTGEFISKFSKCFKQFVMPERTWIYVTEVDEEE